VRASVLPLLNKNKTLSLVELKAALFAWIETVRQEVPIIICYDSEYDCQMLDQIFKQDTPNGVIFRNLDASYINKLKCTNGTLSIRSQNITH
jgi:hypothetical protein